MTNSSQNRSIWISHRLCAGLIFLSVLALYAFTCARTVTMEDSGEFLLSAYRLGIAHPPGYPLFVMLGHLFSRLPFGSIAYSIHLMSALAGTITCCLVYFVSFRLTRHQLAAAAAALLLAISHTFWSQSVIAEVYALNAMLFFAVFLLGLRLEDRFDPRLFYLAGFLFGLALTNSWPLIILESGAFAVLLWPLRRQLPRALPGFAASLLVGLLPYAFLVYRSHQPGTTFFINPVPDFASLWAYVARSTYASENVQPTWTAYETLRFLLHFLKMLATEFGWFGVPLLLVGLYASWQKIPKLLNLALLMAFLSTPVFLLFAWRWEFNELTQLVYSVFHLVPFGMAVLWMSAGFSWLSEQAWMKRPQFVTTVLASAAILIGFSLNFRENNLRNDSFAQDFATISLSLMPPNSTLLVWGDSDTGPFVYTSLIEKFRPDITVTSQMGVIFPERVFDRELHRTDQARASRLVSYVRQKKEAGLPVYSTRRLVYPDVTKSFPYHYKNVGPVEEITLAPQPPAFDNALIEAAQKFLDKVVDGTYKNHWSYHRKMLIRRFCHVMVISHRDHPLLHQSADCKMALVQQAANVEKNYPEAVRLLREVIAGSPLLPSQDKADLMQLLLVNRIHEVNRQAQDGRTRLAGYQSAVDEVLPYALRFRSCLNSAATAVLEIRSQVNVNVDVATLHSIYRKCPPQRVFLEKIMGKKQ